ncbi:uncharacterized protein LOC143436775 [Arvicanthis niloticus]|uniref:uncharacterized protein LOC143436775 n=1 Tax=Arvicanthis niloticus TaxID=61156 RepID=UPI00403D2D56
MLLHRESWFLLCQTYLRTSLGEKHFGIQTWCPCASGDLPRQMCWLENWSSGGCDWVPMPEPIPDEQSSLFSSILMKHSGVFTSKNLRGCIIVLSWSVAGALSRTGTWRKNLDKLPHAVDWILSLLLAAIIVTVWFLGTFPGGDVSWGKSLCSTAVGARCSPRPGCHCLSSTPLLDSFRW